MRIYAYKLGSETAKKLASALGTKIVRPHGDFRNNKNHKIINWGSTVIPSWRVDTSRFLNNPLSVTNSVNKILTLQRLLENNIPHVEFTAEKSVAQQWSDTGVVVRGTVSGYGGRGVRVITEGEIPDAPLYTRFVPKAREYRFHVFNGEIIDIQQKKRRSGLEERPDGLIKNLANGWVFCRDEITPFPDNAVSVALNTIRVLGLNFGAVDMLSKNGQVYVLEVNSAPGLDGTTLEKYINKIKQYES